MGLEQGVWSFRCPNCGRWDLEPPKNNIVSEREIEQVLVEDWGWVPKEAKHEYEALGYEVYDERVTTEWTVKLHDGTLKRLTQNLLMEWWNALANPTVVRECPFCGRTLQKRWISHTP